MELFRIVLVVGPMFVGLGIFMGVIMLGRKRRLAGRKSPLTHGLLRPAGHTLRAQFDDVYGDVMGWLMVVMFVPAIAGALYSGVALRHDQPFSWFDATFYLGLMVVVIGFSVYRLLLLHHKAMNIRMGWDAEMATGQELDQLMRSGAFVFHDLPAKTFNVDHVLICPSGIYAVETKSRMKAIDSGKEGVKVTFDGNALSFPGWKDAATVEQARRQAKWLETELTKAMGEPVRVVGVIALPGWYVVQTGRFDVRALNPKSFQYLLEGRGQPLSDVFMKRVAYQVDQWCRDVAPAYSTTLLK